MLLSAAVENSQTINTKDQKNGRRDQRKTSTAKSVRLCAPIFSGSGSESSGKLEAPISAAKTCLPPGGPKCQIEVIDEDQGQSGASADNRKGFQRLVSEVALGEVGAVFGLEISGLARSCADWYRLMEVASLASTLIIDEEGVYDPNRYNDRVFCSA